MPCTRSSADLLGNLQVYKSVDSYCRFVLTTPGKEQNNQEYLTQIKWRTHNPEWNETIEFQVKDDWDDV